MQMYLDLWRLWKLGDCRPFASKIFFARHPRAGGDPVTLMALDKKQPAVYILASDRNGTLYIGVTSTLIQRIWQHREEQVDGFSKLHHVKQLVWFEQHGTMESAIIREKQLKKWNRLWKLRLIESVNPHWRDLWNEITE